MTANTRTSSPGVRNTTSSGHRGIRCAPNGKNQPMSPASPSSPPSPASIYASSSPASNSSGSSTPLTPQSPSQESAAARTRSVLPMHARVRVADSSFRPPVIYRRPSLRIRYTSIILDVARRLTAEHRPSRTASPCPSPNANANPEGDRDDWARRRPCAGTGAGPAMLVVSARLAGTAMDAIRRIDAGRAARLG
jgi:hypothetical protein